MNTNKYALIQFSRKMWTYINNTFTDFTTKHKMIGKSTIKIVKNQSLRAVQGKVF